MKTASRIMKTAGLWIIVMSVWYDGQVRPVALIAGIVLMLGAWYLLDYYHSKKGQE